MIARHGSLRVRASDLTSRAIRRVQNPRCADTMNDEHHMLHFSISLWQWQCVVLWQCQCVVVVGNFVIECKLIGQDRSLGEQEQKVNNFQIHGQTPHIEYFQTDKTILELELGKTGLTPSYLFILHRSKDKRNFHICAPQYPQCSSSDESCFRTIFVALLVFQLRSAFEGRS